MNSQRMEALAIANEVRTEGAAIRRKVKSGELDPAEVIRTCTHPIPVRRLLKSIPKIGSTRADKMMREAGIDPFKCFATRTSNGDRERAITPEQREKLSTIVEGRFA